MAYTPNSPAWATGNPEDSGPVNDAKGGLVTASRLNKMESGIQDAASVADSGISNVSLSGTVLTFTSAEGAQSIDLAGIIPEPVEPVEPLVATVASASTVLFKFSDDGSTFSFTGGSFGWFASHSHFGVFTAGPQIDIPFQSGRMFVLDISNPDAPNITTMAVSPSMTFTNDQYVIGNMWNDGSNPVVRKVQVYGAGEYSFTVTGE